MQFGDRLHAFVVLSVDGVPVATVGTSPAVVVHDAAVHLTILGSGPPAYTLAIVVDHEIDELAPLASVDIQPAPGAIHVGVAGVRRNWRRRTGFGNQDFQAPNPETGAR
jgi:hypothetical protein